MDNTIPQTETWQKIDYPSRYYAYSDNTAYLGGFPRAGWVDVNIFSQKPDWLPIASDMIALTQNEWDSRSLINQIIKDGKVQTYTVPTTTATASATEAAAATTSTSTALPAQPADVMVASTSNTTTTDTTTATPTTTATASTDTTTSTTMSASAS